MDYGAPVGYRIAARHPERVQSLIVQNGNAYEEGLRDFWKPLRRTGATVGGNAAACASCSPWNPRAGNTPTASADWKLVSPTLGLSGKQP